MISPFSLPVITTSSVISLPAVWSTWRGTLPLDIALSRFLVILLACWVALSAAASLLIPQPAAAGSPGEAAGPAAPDPHQPTPEPAEGP